MVNIEKFNIKWFFFTIFMFHFGFLKLQIFARNLKTQFISFKLQIFFYCYFQFFNLLFFNQILTYKITLNKKSIIFNEWFDISFNKLSVQIVFKIKSINMFLFTISANYFQHIIMVFLNVFPKFTSIIVRSFFLE